jgi:serine protease Do
MKDGIRTNTSCLAFFSVAVILAALIGVGDFGFAAKDAAPAPGSSAPTALKELSDAFVQISEKVTPAVVNISSTKKMGGQGHGQGPDLSDPMFKNHPFREFFGDDLFKRFKHGGPFGKEFRQHGMGSGVIVSADGLIMTNAHVVKGADEIKATLSDGRSFTAKVKGVDPESDIALIKIDASGLPTAKLGDSDKLRVGEIVVAIGSPFGLNKTVTSGVVSAKGRSNVGIIEYEDFIQTDAAINPGNSGGPLVNINGEVIGINTAIATRSGGYQGIGFAIPANSAKLIMEALLKEGKVRRGLLGVNIQDLNESLAKSFGRSDTAGALVSQVISGSPAEKAGIKSGDIITKLNGVAVESSAGLKNAVGRLAPGSTAKLTIYRNKKEMTVEAKIGERDPKEIAEATGGSAGDSSNELGAEVESVPPAAAEKMGIKGGSGVRVRDLDEDGVGARIGLKPGDVVLEVEDETVTDPATFSAAVAKAKKTGTIRLKIQRGKNQIFIGGNF